MKAKFYISFSILILFTALSLINAQQKENTVTDLPAREFIDKIENFSGRFEIIDVRTPGEFNSGKIRGALNIDFYNPDFRNELDKLDRNKAYFIYCRSSNRSSQAGKIMSELGFKEIYNLSGGVIRDANILNLE